MLVVLGGCTTERPEGRSPGDPGPVDTGGVPPTGCEAPMAAQIGTGATAYVELHDGDPVTMVHGPQGGWHVETAARISASAQEVSVIPTLFATALGLQIGGEQQPQFLALANYGSAACAGEVWGVRAFIDDQDPAPDGMTPLEFVCSLEGQELQFTVDVTDIVEGTRVSSTVTVLAELDASDVALCGAL